MDCNEFRVVPEFKHLAVNANGNVMCSTTDTILKQYTRDGYRYIHDSVEGVSHRVHRLVALAWVKNPDPEKFTIINHIDGRRFNNWYENLEWTDYSGNNYHAVNTGLRPDALCCSVRDFFTKEVKDFPSVTQATAYMGIGTNFAPFLKTRKFGKLIKGRYEFRMKTDPEPWFYENRKSLINPSRYLVTVVHEDGRVTEHYTYSEMLQAYQLYNSPNGKSIPELTKYAQQLFPGKKFSYRDGFREYRKPVHRPGKPVVRTKVIAEKGDEILEFDSVRECSKHFGGDRSKIIGRLDTGKELEGWTFRRKPGQPEKTVCYTFNCQEATESSQHQAS